MTTQEYLVNLVTTFLKVPEDFSRLFKLCVVGNSPETHGGVQHVTLVSQDGYTGTYNAPFPRSVFVSNNRGVTRRDPQGAVPGDTLYVHLDEVFPAFKDLGTEGFRSLQVGFGTGIVMFTVSHNPVTIIQVDMKI